MKLLFLHASLLSAVALTLFSLQGGPATKPASRAATTLEAHVAELRARVPRGFTVIAEPPFAVIGDEPRSAVEGHARNTVRWAVDQLKRHYFEKDPKEIIDVWLFKDGESYRKHALDLFGDRPTTPYGYYSAKHRALIMDISTGGGTLVHEIVHPYIAANFPDCPAWFNEGLGSLYEQSGERGGRIVGRTNWRLAGLQSAIRDKTVPSFERLTGTTSSEFYGKGSGVHYAQARYLLYYLQEKGQLVRFYREFREKGEVDPTGYETLKQVLGRDDMDAFQKEWETFVLGLKF